MKTTGRALTCASAVSCAVVLLLGSCGGGGGGGGGSPPPGIISFSTNAISFTAAGPFAAAPPTQTITGTVSGVTSGTLYLKIVANNAVASGSSGFFTVGDVTISGFSGQASVFPAIPSSIDAGTFKGSITVTACLNDPSCQTGQLSGSPETIAVSYDIASGVNGNTVTPHIVAANSPGEVILRGSGFTGSTSVSFGTTAATAVSIVSDSEIHASYPALPAGMYSVTVGSSSVSYSATLIAVSPPAFTATTISYPLGAGLSYPQTAELEYDAQRAALFVLLPGGVSTNATLLRYAFDGNSWGSPTQISVAGLVQVHLSPDGLHLLALTAPDAAHTSMVELDPVTLSQVSVTTVSNPSSMDIACGFALANDGNAVVGNADSFGFAFGTFNHVFTPLADGGGCDPVASGNGAVVARNISMFVASSETVADGGPQTGTGTTVDLAGDKFATAGVLENGSGQSLGIVGGIFGQLMNSAGTRLYGVTPDPVSFQPTLVTFDLTATPVGSPYPEFPELGAPVTLPGCALGTCPEAFYSLATTPDGATLFIAGPNYVVVQPVSP
jgi:hypothetical protein